MGVVRIRSTRSGVDARALAAITAVARHGIPTYVMNATACLKALHGLLQRRSLRRLGQGPEQPTMAAGAVDRPHGEWRLLPRRDHRGPGCGIIGVAGRCAR